MANKKLGRGIGAVFGEDIDSVLNDIANGSVAETQKNNLKISDIRPNPYQPRKVFNNESLNELADSIKEVGVIQPILVRKAISGYELLAGERRLRASKMAGKKEIPAIIVEVNDQDMMEYALLENVQREDLNIIEEAQGYDQLIKKLKYTQEELSKRIGKSRAHITNTLRILKLPQEILDLLSRDRLTFGHARALINIDDEDKQIELAKKAASEGLSVRDVEKLANQAKDTNKKVPPKKKTDPYLEDIRKAMEASLSTNVEVNKKKIIINYSDVDDLNRILEILGFIED